MHSVEFSADLRKEVNKPKFVIYLGNDEKSKMTKRHET